MLLTKEQRPCIIFWMSRLPTLAWTPSNFLADSSLLDFLKLEDGANRLARNVGN